MKKFLLSFSLVVLFVSAQAFAGNGDIFTYNKKAINTEFAELNAIEDYVILNEGITFSEMLSGNSEIADKLSVLSLSNFPMIHEGPLGIPSFLWGCVLGPLGVLVVYLIADDPSAEARKAFWGCLIGSLLQAGSWTLYSISIN